MQGLQKDIHINKGPINYFVVLLFWKIVVTFEKLVHFSLREIIYHLITLLDDKNDEVSCYSAIAEKQ